MSIFRFGCFSNNNAVVAGQRAHLYQPGDSTSAIVNKLIVRFSDQSGPELRTAIVSELGLKLRGSNQGKDATAVLAKFKEVVGHLRSNDPHSSSPKTRFKTAATLCLESITVEELTQGGDRVPTELPATTLTPANHVFGVRVSPAKVIPFTTKLTVEEGELNDTMELLLGNLESNPTWNYVTDFLTGIPATLGDAVEKFNDFMDDKIATHPEDHPRLIEIKSTFNGWVDRHRKMTLLMTILSTSDSDVVVDRFFKDIDATMEHSIQMFKLFIDARLGMPPVPGEKLRDVRARFDKLAMTVLLGRLITELKTSPGV